MTYDDVPLVSFDALWHRGTMDAADKGCRGESHEGHGLSVSTDPDAWEEIAKLGGEPLWELSRDGNRFLDAHGLSECHRRKMSDWAESEGLAVRADAWRWSRYDDEADARLHGFAATMVDAAWEAGYEGLADDIDACTAAGEPLPEIPEEAAACISRENMLVPTQALCERLKVSGAGKPTVMLDDWVAITFAEEVLQLDGVWWSDRLDPASLSAPRGVIFPDRLQNWVIARIDHTPAP